MAPASDQPAPGPGRDPDILTAGEVAERLGFRDAKTIRDATSTGGGNGGIPGGLLGLYSWRAVYAWLAGDGIPEGEVLDAKQLAARLDISEQKVRRGAASPGTPGKLPGRQAGGKWLFAWEAVVAAIRNPAQPAAAPGTEDAGTAG